jgi:hypothetical protein
MTDIRPLEQMLLGNLPCNKSRVKFVARLRSSAVEWNIFHINHRLPDALKSDRQRGPTTLRQQVVAWLEAFAELSEEHGHMRGLGRSARTLWESLHKLWPTESCTLPYYPAFRDSVENIDLRIR